MIALDRNADTFPVGLAGTPFEEVYRALRVVAASVWAVDPTVYRAGMAWGWYALHAPSALFGFRDVVTEALISEMAPMVKASQTDAELVEYLRQWREYTPTFPKLQALYALFGAVVDIQPVSDPESQSVLPVDDTRLAFYIRIESVDFSRPLTLAEAREIAVRATPLGSRPYPYYALETRIPCTVSPAPVGIYIRLENWETARPPAPAQQLGELVFVDASTGAVVYSVETLNEMVFVDAGYFTIDNTDDVVLVEQSPYPIRCNYSQTYSPNPTVADGGTLAFDYPQYASKLYIPLVITIDQGVSTTYYYGWDMGDGVVVNNTGESLTVFSIILVFIDSANASIVTVVDNNNSFRQAFKYTLNGTDYYYVIDGENEFWTDDLASIGYREAPPALPTVVTTNSFNYRFKFNTSGSDYTFSANGTTSVYKDTSGTPRPDWDSSKVYGVIKYWNYDETQIGRQGITPIEAPSWGEAGKIYMKNNSGSVITVAKIRVATCDDLSATVVTVYDSQNVAYNAFKYTENDTDYYYVLDGTQTDWTDDLAGIGYSLTPNY